ncbi:MAG: protein kinase, partial [Actinomycetia bacterium]|nr:protein kinase [Actinomycetes bacterium]
MGERGVWSWDLSEIAERSFTDNVVELMTGRISALEGATARALQLAACIGSRFGLQRLAAVLEVEPAAAATTLWPAIEAELVVPLDDSYRLMQTEAAGDLDPRYRFAHDRVQQAAHDLLSEGDRAATHLQLARAELDAGELQDEGLFSIATHANFGAAQVVETSERARYARLNLQAGRKAKRSAAFEPALRYLLAGRAFLADPWGGDGYPLAFELAEIHYLVGEHEAAEALFAELLEHSTEALDRARIFNLKLVLYGNTGRYPEAIDCAVQALAHCGERFSARPGKAGLSLELLRTLRLLRGKTPEGLQDLQ